MSKSSERREGYSINRVLIFQRLCQFYKENNQLSAANNILIILGEQLFWGAFYDAPDFEKSKVIWTMSSILRQNEDLDVSSSELLSNIKNGCIHYDFLQQKNHVKRHWIVKIMTPLCPMGTERRRFASFIYQNLRKSYFSLKNGTTFQNLEVKRDPIIEQMDQQKVALEYLCTKYVVPYLETTKNEILPLPLVDGQKIIWQYWDAGVRKAPKIVQRCIASVDKNLPKGYKHIVLDDTNVLNYVQLPQFVFDKMKLSSSFNKTFFSDLLRLFLLSKYGGVWIDATVLLTSQIPEDILKSEFFCFYRGEEPQNSEALEKFNPMYFSWRKDFLVRMCNSFIVAKPQYPFVEALKSILLKYWESETEFSFYFTFQIIFEYLIHDKKFESLSWRHIDDLLFHELLLICKKEFKREEWDGVCERIFAHKLTYLANESDSSYFKLIENGEIG